MSKHVSPHGKNNRYIASVLLVLGLLVLQGCASAPPRTGFIPGHVALQPVPEDKSLLWWQHPEFKWQAYRRVILDPVQIQIDPAQAGKKVKMEELQSLADKLRTTVAAELAPEYPVVDTPEEDVLRIRAAITEIDPANPTLNVVTALALFVPMDMGGVSIEAEFIDSVTGRRLAAMADQKKGSPLQLVSSLKRFGHVQAAFDQWAEALKSALAQNP